MEEEERRLFIGIPLPDEVRERFHALDPKIPGLRWLDPSVLHITVCFIGESSLDPEKEVLPPLKKETEKVAPFSMPFEGLMKAPPRKSYMVWALYRNVPPFQKLYERSFRTFLPEKGEPRDPIPHVTLGRMKRGKSLKGQKLPEPPDPGPLKVDHLVLWRSELRKGGAVHHPLGKAPLRGSEEEGSAGSS